MWERALAAVSKGVAEAVLNWLDKHPEVIEEVATDEQKEVAGAIRRRLGSISLHTSEQDSDRPDYAPQDHKSGVGAGDGETTRRLIRGNQSAR